MFGKKFGVGVVVDEVAADECFGDFVLVEVVEIDAGRGNVYQLAYAVVPYRGQNVSRGGHVGAVKIFVTPPRRRQGGAMEHDIGFGKRL